VQNYNFPVVLYGCETWSLKLREEHGLKMNEDGLLREIFGPEKDELTGTWRNLHNEEFYGFYCSLNIIRVIKSRRVRWSGHVARMGRGEVHTGFLWGGLGERDHLEDSGVDGRMILKLIFKKWYGEVRTGLICLRIVTCIRFL
jgi:hypothetical protein